MEAHALTIRMVQKVWDRINNFHTVNKMCSPEMQGDCVIVWYVKFKIDTEFHLLTHEGNTFMAFTNINGKLMWW